MTGHTSHTIDYLWI